MFTAVTMLSMAAMAAATAGDTAWAHAMDKNCCGGGESCGFVYCAGQSECVQSWAVDDFDTDCAPGAKRRLDTVDTAWAHAMDKNCCGGGEACGFVYCAGQSQCVQSWDVDDFDSDCAPGAKGGK